ncbi:MAG: hypothetical protein DRG63_02060 [Deltaproteobacteria bacterium]|nr:MAG: hypothetical protein DRG63_02060 [Deltaproteobacteria bacterium]
MYGKCQCIKGVKGLNKRKALERVPPKAEITSSGINTLIGFRFLDESADMCNEEYLKDMV